MGFIRQPSPKIGSVGDGGISRPVFPRFHISFSSRRRLSFSSGTRGSYYSPHNSEPVRPSGAEIQVGERWQWKDETEEHRNLLTLPGSSMKLADVMQVMFPRVLLDILLVLRA